MDRKIQQFAGALRAPDAGAFHYSGHGWQVAGVNCLRFTKKPRLCRIGPSIPMPIDVMIGCMPASPIGRFEARAPFEP
jgi:hypothetical protein